MSPPGGGDGENGFKEPVLARGAVVAAGVGSAPPVTDARPGTAHLRTAVDDAAPVPASAPLLALACLATRTAVLASALSLVDVVVVVVAPARCPALPATGRNWKPPNLDVVDGVVAAVAGVVVVVDDVVAVVDVCRMGHLRGPNGEDDTAVDTGAAAAVDDDEPVAAAAGAVGPPPAPAPSL